MSASSEDPRVGLLVQGRYRVLRKLGEGGMGAVYEGKHELIGRRVAIKTLHAHFAQNPELVERFHREANAATSVGNEHIIEVTDFGFFDDDSPFIVMEFLEGVELGDLLEREGSLPIARLVHIIEQVCDALSAAHVRGIVHRDMKPENVYLIKRGQDRDFVKVLDFGISKMRAQGDDLKNGLTRTGMALGTPYYMPPEQAQGLRDIDQRADVYAVGVIMYRALGGRLPFDAETYPALMVKIMTETPAALRSLRADVPEELDRLVLRAMARDRQHRFQNVEELALALRPFAALNQTPHMLASLRPTPQTGQTGTPYTSDVPSRPAPAPSGSSDAGIAKLALIAGMSLAAVGVGVAIWAVFGRDPRAGNDVVSAPPPAPAPHVAGAAQAGLPVQPAAAVAVAAAPAPEAARPIEVRLQIDAKPAEARIFIAGAEFPNPTDASRPRSLDPVRIRVEAPGHQAQEQLAIFDQDRSLHFVLQKGHGTRELAAAGDRDKRPREQPAAADAPTAVPAAPPAEPATPKEDGIYQGPTGKIRDEF